MRIPVLWEAGAAAAPMPIARLSSTTTWFGPSLRPFRVRSGFRSPIATRASMMNLQLRILALASLAAVAVPVATRAQAVDNSAAPLIPFEAADFIQLKPGQNLGEVLGVAVSSKGNVVILNHPGSATTGPLYGNATTEILEYDKNGKFLREIGHGVYALGYSHSVRFDKYDNLWVVDKGTDSVIKFDPSGKAVLNLGRRPEGYDSGHEPHLKQSEAVPIDGWFRAPTDVAWDADDNIFVSDGYINSRIAKLTKD